MPGPVFLHGERVTLRVLEEADLPFVQRAANDPDLRRATGGQQFPSTRAYEERQFEARDADPEVLELLICADGDPVGVVAFEQLDRDADAATLSYWLVPEARGNGYAREAVERFLTFGFDELGLHRVTAEAFSFNERSQTLLDRLGFTHEGTRREDVFADGRRHATRVYGLLAREWRD
ncbi:MAG: GNAT family N-acetyltransferase [Haloarculaceae archaeon]